MVGKRIIETADAKLAQRQLFVLVCLQLAVIVVLAVVAVIRP